jgi:gluconolactonase
LTLSLDEKLLFVNDSTKAHIRVFDNNDGGTISNGREWARVTGDRVGFVDGMKVDAAGNLYVTGPGGIHVFACDAACLGVIYVPQNVTNFTWGDDDLKTLYITAGTSLYKRRVKLPGRTLF